MITPICPQNYTFNKEKCVCILDTKPCKEGKHRNENGRCVLIKTQKANKSIPPKKIKLKLSKKILTPTIQNSTTIKVNKSIPPKKIKLKLSKKILTPTIQNSTTNKVGKKRPCKEGKHRNENGRCVLIKTQNVKKPRCPKNTRRNKKGICEPVSKNDDLTLSAMIKSNNADAEKTIGKTLITLLEKSSKIKGTPSKNNSVKQMVNERSFSPAINKIIISMNNKPRFDIFKCDSGNNKEFILKLINLKVNDLTKLDNATPIISVGLTSSGRPLCSPIDSKEAQEVLLNNLKNTSFDNNQIITPLQISSNCWFNTMFVVFFFSDKGRKFFRFFRQLMITGKDSNGNKIPEYFAKGLRIWNLCIEASYGNKDVAFAMNTNHVISLLHNAIPTSPHSVNKGIVDVGISNNPLTFYESIIKYIDVDEIKMFRIQGYKKYKDLINKKVIVDSAPDLMVIEINNNNSLLGKYRADKMEVLSKDGGVYTYVLDSAIVRDTKKQHFCSLVMCNGQQMGFDGASHSRMSPLKWKDFLVGKQFKKKWGFIGSNFNQNVKTPIKWSFSDGYHILFYYRTSK